MGHFFKKTLALPAPKPPKISEGVVCKQWLAVFRKNIDNIANFQKF